MSLSFSSVTPTNMQLCPMRVNYNGVDLGGTLGNVTVKVDFKKANIMADQLGKTVLDRRVSAIEITVVTELAEIVNKSNIKVANPHAKLVTSGGGTLNYFQSAIGDGDLSNAQQLILHPLALPDSDKSQDWTFYKTCAAAVVELVYGPEEQTKTKITWNVLPDTSVVPAKFCAYGDVAVGLVNASAGSPVFSGSGNGSLSSISVFNGFTKTETVTATCVGTAPSGGRFNVNGSLTGPMGLATVGLQFNSNQISFLISTGSISFAVNDVFTIPTVAANYV